MCMIGSNIVFMFFFTREVSSIMMLFRLKTCVVTVSPVKPPGLTLSTGERPAMGNWFSSFLSSRDPDRAAVTIQRVWRGHRQRLFLKSGYYYSSRGQSRKDHRSHWLANLEIPEIPDSNIQLPSPDSDTAVIAAKERRKQRQRMLGLCWLTWGSVGGFRG